MIKELDRELKYLEDDIKLCDITTNVRLNRFDKSSKEKPKEHLLKHINFIKQTLTPPTADEIVKELNEHYGVNDVIYINDKYHHGFAFKNSLYIVKYEDKNINFINNEYLKVNILPINLAHDITTFFMNEKEGK